MECSSRHAFSHPLGDMMDGGSSVEVQEAKRKKSWSLEMEGKRGTGRAEVCPSESGKVLTVKCHSGSFPWCIHPTSIETQNSVY